MKITEITLSVDVVFIKCLNFSGYFDVFTNKGIVKTIQRKYNKGDILKVIISSNKLNGIDKVKDQDNFICYLSANHYKLNNI